MYLFAPRQCTFDKLRLMARAIRIQRTYNAFVYTRAVYLSQTKANSKGNAQTTNV